MRRDQKKEQYIDMKKIFEEGEKTSEKQNSIDVISNFKM